MPGLIGGVARTAVAAGTWTAVSNRVNRRQQERWAEQDQQQMMQQQQQQAYAQSYAPPAPPPPRAAPSPDDKFAQLEKLGQLKNAGILTDAEFDAQKAKILAS
jgi:Short C-terminal domain/Domain of unknwon function (DUF3824)